MSQNKKLEKFNFSPSEGFLNQAYYHDPTNEVETRTQLMSLHTQTQKFINALIDSLNSPNGASNITVTIDGVEYNVQEVLQMHASNKITGYSDIKALRLNGDNQTEYFNGSTWKLLGSGGHEIIDKEGVIMPQTPKLQFLNSTIETKGNITVVHGVKGDQGETGPMGPQGIQGNRGPAGPQGVQGAQGPKGNDGAVGATGPQGPTGKTGPQGQRGPQGLEGERGPMGIQGPKGESAVIPEGVLYALGVDEDGNLKVFWGGNSAEPPQKFRLDEQGNLYAIIG